jgi:Exodeoxyribonuclease VII large subunit (EC 3.1.11.6)
VVITRGGGSQDDLFVFNSEAVVRAIYGIAKPTIVAIGHERDTTLSELVADLRCATPSQAAEKVSLSNSEISWQAKSSIELIYRGTELEFVIMVIAVSCVKLLSAHNSTQHTSRKHKV